MDPELQDIERQLTGLRPAPLSDDFLARMEAIALRVPAVKEASSEDKILPFPSVSARETNEKKRESHRPAWAAAAAVAILGAMTALMVPRGGTSASSAPVASTGGVAAIPQNSAPMVQRPSMVGNSAIVPASLGGPSVMSAQDQGVMSGPNGPMRMMRVVYRESVKVPTEDGRWIEIQQPREEWILVPEKFQ